MQLVNLKLWQSTPFNCVSFDNLQIIWIYARILALQLKVTRLTDANKSLLHSTPNLPYFTAVWEGQEIPKFKKFSQGTLALKNNLNNNAKGSLFPNF